MTSFDPNDEDFKYLAVDRKKMIKEAAPFDAKKDCFVPDPKEGFAHAEIQSAAGDDVTVKIKHDNSVSSDDLFISFVFILKRFVF